jgi:hypothetical protein
MMLLGRRSPAFLPAEQRHAEHAQRERGERQAGLHRVVLEHHLQEDRQCDHRAAESYPLEHLLGDPVPEDLGSEEVGIQQCRFALTLAPHEPGHQCAQRHRTDRQQGGDGLPAFLPHEYAEHDAPHAQDREDRTDRVDAPGSGVRHVADEPDADQHDRDDDILEQQDDAPQQIGGDEASCCRSG